MGKNHASQYANFGSLLKSFIKPEKFYISFRLQHTLLYGNLHHKYNQSYN